MASTIIESYDIVIVGAGNAGAVLAARLSEVPSLNVLLIEVGGDHSSNPKLHIPTGGKALWSDPEINWDYYTVPQKGFNGRQINHPRGKGLGGTTLVNLNMMTFPDRGSIDNWAALGNDGWDYETLQPYYRKFHTFHEPDEEVSRKLSLSYMDAKTHGTSGPIQVSFGTYQSVFDEAWTKTFANLGQKATKDPLTGDALGGHNAPGTVDPSTATRSYSAGAYLTEEVRRRKNLCVLTEVLVEKVLIEKGEDVVRATGVQYVSKDGERHTVKANHEVIVSCGVFKSPQLLELSGIGSSEVLSAHGIEVNVDLPGVGRNLQDHAVVGVSFETAVASLDSFRDPSKIEAAFNEYMTKQSGPLSCATFCAAFLPCVEDVRTEQAGQLQKMFQKHLGDGSTPEMLQRQYQIIRATNEDPHLSSIQFLLAPVQMSPDQSPAVVSDAARQADYITLFASLSHPFSRGTCHIQSADPHASPSIDPQYFSHPLDVEIVARHLRFLETIVSMDPLAGLLKPNGFRIPSDVDLNSLEGTRDLTKTGFTTYHPCGTCSMMPREDGGVVDSQLRVYGVRGLRVVDASVFPLIPRGNIQSSVYAVAERAADLIKANLAA